MTLDSWIVTGAIAGAVVYLGLRGYSRYKKEARKLQACQSCPVLKERGAEGVTPPPPPDSKDR